MIESITGKWNSMTSTTRWALYIPAFIVAVAVIYIPSNLIMAMLNSRIWGGWMSTMISSALLGFIAVQLAYRMAPSAKMLAAALVTLPVSAIAAFTIIYYVSDGQEPGSGLEALWGATWFVSAVLTMISVSRGRA